MIENLFSDGAALDGPRLGDAWGALLLACFEAGAVPGAVLELIERDDGFIDGGDAARYFARPDAWDALDRLACAEARGRILDVGAGAGRAALYLQETVHDVVALDVSPGAVDVCQRRGVRRTVIGTVQDLVDADAEPFDTFLLLGTNLGLLASAAQAPRFLNALARLAASDAVVLGRGMDPYHTLMQAHRAYHERNRALGRLPGQIRLRVRYQNLATPWFDYLFASVEEIKAKSIVHMSAASAASDLGRTPALRSLAPTYTTPPTINSAEIGSPSTTETGRQQQATNVQLRPGRPALTGRHVYAGTTCHDTHAHGGYGPMTTDLMKLDATAQAALVRQTQVSPLDLVDIAIARIQRVDPVLNAVITPLFEQARRHAQSTSSNTAAPFHGVPLLLKDYLCQTTGDPYYAGLRYLRDLGWRSPQDTFLAQKFRAAGFNFLGKTNLPELARGPTTEPQAFGPTRNPWDPARSAGGSSGGSAAAVASGMVAVAHGNDGTGSLRIPASCCGLVGLKPSRGRISLGPGNSGGLLGNVVEFALVRSVRDAAGILDAIAGPMPGDLFMAPPPGSYVLDICADPGRRRVGLLVDDPFLSHPVHPECTLAVERTGRFLESLGDSIEYSYPPAFEGPTGLGPALHQISASGLAATLDAWSATTGHSITAQDVEPGTWAAAEEGRTFTAVQIHAACQRLLMGIGRAGEWWANDFDLLITPTMSEPPPRLGLSGADMGKVFGLFCMAASLAGLPAISLPLHWTPDGLPIGVQLVAAYGREDLLLQTARQLEEAFPWADRWPTLP